MERDDACQNNEQLWNDIDRAKQRIVSAKEHPRPCSIKRELYEKQGQRQPARGEYLRQPEDAP